MKNAILSVILMSILIATAPLIALVVDDKGEAKQSNATVSHNKILFETLNMHYKK